MVLYIYYYTQHVYSFCRNSQIHLSILFVIISNRVKLSTMINTINGYFTGTNHDKWITLLLSWIKFWHLKICSFEQITNIQILSTEIIWQWITKCSCCTDYNQMPRNNPRLFQFSIDININMRTVYLSRTISNFILSTLNNYITQTMS